ncbi:MAG: histidine kinase [Bacteroidetes bacterium]|nr:histidine kinase [Bacteroidota bacterium]
MFPEAVVIFFIARYLRKILESSPKLAEWDNRLRLAWIAAIVLLGLSIVLSVTEPVLKWFMHALMFFTIITIHRNDEFRPGRWLITAVAPFLIVTVNFDIVNLFKFNWLNSVKEYEDAARTFSIIWMGAMYFISRRQRKALDKERMIRMREEEQNKIIAARKNELEYLVTERTAEITKQKEELQHALTDLKSTQVQLIQQEKMASLGELTAGIAHEIQNPLNFVNNFSEISIELSQELKEEIEKPEIDKPYIVKLLTDISLNQQKINHHGKRADAIVKGMLQHSRTSAGKTEPTDINALADEYMRLSYHGLRAKDKVFNATLQTKFDESIGKISVVPQEIGRVLLNLFNNAFYAVSEKKKASGSDYVPIVSVTTKKIGNKIEIRVKDNGMGVDDKVLDKIFQPFFTTKPTGQGTGLGLSLSYDIVKAHRGEIKVETKKGEGSEFVIEIPGN